MKKNKTYGPLMLSFFLVGNAATAIAADDDSPFSASVYAGYEYDSNITVDSIDSNANVGDNAFVLEGALGYKIVDDNDVGLSVGYDFYQSLHDDVTEFDLQIHGFNADARYTLKDIDLGMAYGFNTIKLGGDSFLDLHSIRPNIGYLTASDKVYLIASYEYQDQKFKSAALMARDATKNSLSIKSIYLMGEGKTLTAGYTFSDLNANDDAYSYKGNAVDLSLKIPFEIMDNETTFRASYRYLHKNFGVESLKYGVEERSDERHSFRTSLEVPIINGFKGKVQYEYINSNSTLATVDYNENIYTASLGWEF